MIINVKNNENLSGNYGSGTVINCQGHVIISGSVSSSCIINASSVQITGTIGSSAVLNVLRIDISGSISSSLRANGNIYVHSSGSVGSNCIVTGNAKVAGSVSSNCQINGDLDASGSIGSGCTVSGNAKISGCVSSGFQVSGNLVVSGSIGSGCKVGGNLTLSGCISSSCEVQGNFHVSDSASIGSGFKCKGKWTGEKQPGQNNNSNPTYQTGGFFSGTSGSQSNIPTIISFSYQPGISYSCKVSGMLNSTNFEFGHKNYIIKMSVSGISSPSLSSINGNTFINRQPFIDFIRQFEKSNANVAKFLDELGIKGVRDEKASPRQEIPSSSKSSFFTPQTQNSTFPWNLLRDLGVNATDSRPDILSIDYIKELYRARILIVHPDKNIHADQEQVNRLFRLATSARDTLIEHHLGETIPNPPHNYSVPESPYSLASGLSNGTTPLR